MDDSNNPGIAAATLILLRDRPGEAPEIPMIGRGAHLSFAASRMVFPGGRVDADDHRVAMTPDLLAAGPAIEAGDLAHRIAAIRETIEEIGLAPGVVGIDDVDLLQDVRHALRAEQPFSTLLGRHGLQVDPHLLHPFARWLPHNRGQMRRFDTRFYVARAPDLGEAAADGVESSHISWGTAEAHLSAGEMIFPTIRNLERIGLARDFDDAVALARRFPIETVTPRVEMRDGERWLCIPEHLGYPVTSQLVAMVENGDGPTRVSITDPPG